jgi:2-amino-4-hydroxy-6-hydroxymethyldihydropteridine diphosphokinase
MSEAIILLGGNQGNRWYFLRQASQALQCCGCAIVKASRIYQTQAWGFAADTFFLNQALLITTELSPYVLLHAALDIELRLGRIRDSNAIGYASRCIDIDILLYDERIVSMPDLQIPHPRMHLRRFALIPAAEIVPHWHHPLLRRSIAQLLAQCADATKVEQWQP